MGFEAQHAAALRMLKAKGAAVTFTLESPGTYDPETDTYTSASTTTVAGYAVRVEGDPEVYSSLGLVEQDAVTLLFAPNTFGETPDLGYTVTWGSVVYTLWQLRPVEPDGTVIISQIVGGK